MSAFRHIPEELLLSILSFLVDDPVSLSRCALVCRIWLSASRTHQFHTLRFYHSIRAAKMRKHALNVSSFLKLLKESSSNNIIPYVRELMLDVDNHVLSELYDKLVNGGIHLTRLSIHVDDFQTYPLLERISQDNPELEGLTIIHPPVSAYMTHAPTVPPLRFAASFPKLRFLDIKFYWGAGTSGLKGLAVDPGNWKQLETFRVTCSRMDDVFRWLGEIGWEPVSLKSLALVTDRFEHDGCGPVKHINSFLTAHGATVENFQISIDSYGMYTRTQPSQDETTPSYGHLDLSGLKALRSFSGKMHDARSICGALETLPDSIKLEEAIIHIIPWGMRAIFPNQVPCKVMEEELWSSIAALPCLRDCTLTIRVHRKIETSVIRDAMEGRSFTLETV